MKFGAVFPTQEVGSDPIAIRDFVQAVEGLGYDHLVTYDHVLGAVRSDRHPPLTGPYDETDAFHEPFVLFGYLAAVTTTLELATGVLVLPQRQTALVAKQAAEVALLSGGRLRLAVGTGWNHVEYTSLGADFASRAKRLDEQLVVLRRLLSEPVLDIDGDFHQISRAGLNPLPTSPVPLWCGGSSLPALRRAARLADGFMWGSTRPMVFEQASIVRDLVADTGRDPHAFGLEAVVDVGEGEEEWIARRERFEQLGGTKFSIRTISTASEWMGIDAPGYAHLKEHLDGLARFMEVCR